MSPPGKPQWRQQSIGRCVAKPAANASTGRSGHAAPTATPARRWLVTNNGAAAYDGRVSVPVALDALRERVAEFGAAAYLVTVGENARPHVVSVSVEWAHGRLVAGAGRTTSANVAGRPAASLLWPPLADAGYCLIVDGAAEIQAHGDSGVVVIEPSRAVLHRLVDATGDGPSCVTVL